MKAFLLLLFTVLAACSGGGDNKRDWAPKDAVPNFRSTTGSGVVENPADTFAIPRCGEGKLGYVTTPWRTPLPLGATMTVDFSITASADAKIVGFEDTANGGRIALHFQRKSPNSSDPYALSGKLYDRGYRQWSGVRELLTPGDHTFSAVLTADKWSNRTGFDAARDNPAYAGFTLSGSHSAGHGVCMAVGTAKLTVRGLRIG